jgi:hypothetical protein
MRAAHERVTTLFGHECKQKMWSKSRDMQQFKATNACLKAECQYCL